MIVSARKTIRIVHKDYSHSPYTYCMGNPTMSIDVNGDSCMILLAPYGAGGFEQVCLAVTLKISKTVR